MSSKVQNLKGNYREFWRRISFKFACEVPTVDLWRVVNFREKWSSRFWKNRFLGFDPYAPCVKKKFAIRNTVWFEKRLSTELYTSNLWRWLLYTYYIELSTGGHTFFLFLRFKCPYHLSCSRLSTSATLTRLGKRQFGIFGQLEYNYNTIFVYTIQYNTIFGQFGMQQPDACTWAGLNNSTILKPSKWRHCDPEHCKKEMKISKRA